MEENELFERYKQTGDIALRNQIVEKYLYIAAVIAKKFVGRGVEYDDLYQVAALALVKGVDRFDASKGIKFSTFITPTVTGRSRIISATDPASCTFRARWPNCARTSDRRRRRS